MRLMLAATALALSLPMAATPVAAQSSAPADMARVLADSRRVEDTARDVWRHPAETLAFFQVQPGMTVVDFMPSTGWYTRVIAPYLGAQGTYIGLNPKVAPDATGFAGSMKDTASRFPAQAAPWLGTGSAKVLGANVGSVAEDLNGTVDRFLIFREVHNMRRAGWLHDTMVAARKLLKQGGMLGIVQHRAKADAPADYVLGDKGYQREEDVIALMKAYGFDLVEKSEINANPKDPADWPTGVWTLPPGYSGTPETDTARRAELAAIGESDRMTLLFRKRD